MLFFEWSIVKWFETSPQIDNARMEPIFLVNSLDLIYLYWFVTMVWSLGPQDSSKKTNCFIITFHCKSCRKNGQKTWRCKLYCVLFEIVKKRSCCKMSSQKALVSYFERKILQETIKAVPCHHKLNGDVHVI